jgi:hypothetical protein
VTTPTVESPVARSRRRPPRIAPSLFLLLALVLGGLAAWYFLGRRRLVFTNQLAAPIWLAVGQRPPVTLAPGSAQSLELPGGSVVLQWNLARPLSANQRPMGEELRGSAVLRGERGVIRRSATVRESGSAYFAPLITNAGESQLRISVNAGLEGAVDCGCAIRPGASRAFIGYYRLYQNSTVRARDSAGRTATFRDLGPHVTSANGTLGLRFEAKDFR